MFEDKIILGIDPGTSVLGYGIIQVKKDGLKLITFGVIHLNKIDNHALENNLIAEIKDNDLVTPEVFFNKETRFDFLTEKNKKKSFIEVKNVTLFRDKQTAESQH